ncbi:MAG TPA: cobalamin-binding protein [Gemmatimonadaceae bacterium]|nr:cobalamin-binding protein [Gemmatimonadaceae bacterium]
MRIVSLCPSLTELLFDLGLGDSLVGRTKFCVHPEGRVDAVEKVGGTKNPKLERIIQLAPDLVLLNEEENRREDAEALGAAGVACHVSFPRTALDTAAMVRSIAAAVHTPAEGERIALDIEARHERVVRAAATREQVSYAYLIWRDPWMTLNADTFVSALLGDAGGRNVFASRAERYPAITPDELRAANPDVVLLSTEPFPFTDVHADELSAASGLARDRFRIVDGELLSWHGSRTPSGIDYAEHIMNAARA